MSNRPVVEREFSGAVIRNCVLTPHQADQLVMFMVDHSDDIWEIPDDVIDAVNNRCSRSLSRPLKYKIVVITW